VLTDVTQWSSFPRALCFSLVAHTLATAPTAAAATTMGTTVPAAAPAAATVHRTHSNWGAKSKYIQDRNSPVCAETATLIPLLLYPAAAATRPSYLPRHGAPSNKAVGGWGGTQHNLNAPPSKKLCRLGQSVAKDLATPASLLGSSSPQARANAACANTSSS